MEVIISDKTNFCFKTELRSERPARLTFSNVPEMTRVHIYLFFFTFLYTREKNKNTQCCKRQDKASARNG